jgi:hypothetical protein
MLDKEKKLRQHKKELKSFRNKMGKHIVWFDALASNRQYDLLFLWKREKYKNKDIKVPTKVKCEYGNRFTLQKTYTKYPASIKHFLKIYTLDSRFQPSKVRIREASLKILLNELS